VASVAAALLLFMAAILFVSSMIIRHLQGDQGVVGDASNGSRIVVVAMCILASSGVCFLALRMREIVRCYYRCVEYCFTTAERHTAESSATTHSMRTNRHNLEAENVHQAQAMIRKQLFDLQCFDYRKRFGGHVSVGIQPSLPYEQNVNVQLSPGIFGCVIFRDIFLKRPQSRSSTFSTLSSEVHKGVFASAAGSSVISVQATRYGLHFLECEAAVHFDTNLKGQRADSFPIHAPTQEERIREVLRLRKQARAHLLRTTWAEPMDDLAVHEEIKPINSATQSYLQHDRAECIRQANLRTLFFFPWSPSIVAEDAQKRNRPKKRKNIIKKSIFLANSGSG